MKKLMIAAAIVCAAVAAQAANWRWSATNIGAASQTLLDAGTVAYIFTTDTAMKTVYDNCMTKNWLADNAISSKELSEAGKITAASSVAESDFTHGDANTEYTFYFAILNGTDLYLSNTVTKKSTTSATTSVPIGFGNQKSGANGTFSYLAASKTYVGSGYWQTVPEPTSGLLMLLGMAGLALKRKQRG